MLSTRDRLAYILSVWFGCGLVPGAPGTVGTLGALPLYFLVRPAGPWAVGLMAVVLTVVGIWAADVTAKRLGKKDPQIVVIDEVAGVFVSLTVAPYTVWGVISAVVLFRLFDQFKPFPARYAERHYPGGWGIVMDDIYAGLWGVVVLLAARWWGVL